MSAIDAALDKVLEVFTAAYALADTPPSQARPEVTEGAATGTLPRQWVMVGSARGEQEWAAIGARRRNEDFTIEWVINVKEPGLTTTEARRRAFYLLGVGEAALRAEENVTLQGVCAQGVEVRSPDYHAITTQNGFEAQITSAIRCKARI